MTQLSTAQAETTDTYFKAEITAIGCDADPALVEVIASVGEFDGVILNVAADDRYVLVELTIAEVDEMLAALTAARAVLSR